MKQSIVSNATTTIMKIVRTQVKHMSKNMAFDQDDKCMMCYGRCEFMKHEHTNIYLVVLMKYNIMATYSYLHVSSSCVFNLFSVR